LVLVNEERLKNEYEFRQVIESSNKKIDDLRTENESLEQNLTDK
jgi:anti-sigma-K factor RskA